jgi:hypothetical protein
MQQIEHFLSGYIDDIDCVSTAEGAVKAEGRIIVLPAAAIT